MLVRNDSKARVRFRSSTFELLLMPGIAVVDNSAPSFALSPTAQSSRHRISKHRPEFINTPVAYHGRAYIRVWSCFDVGSGDHGKAESTRWTSAVERGSRKTMRLISPPGGRNRAEYPHTNKPTPFSVIRLVTRLSRWAPAM